MKKLLPTLEIIEPSFGSSFSLTRYAPKTNNKSHFWHCHPEIEIVYVNGGAGKRQVGSHISYFTSGILIIVGSNLPHCGFTDEKTGNKNETVIHFKPDFLGNDFLGILEMRKIESLLQRAKTGVVFIGETKKRIGSQIEMMKDQLPFKRLLTLLSVLNEMEEATEFKVLNAEGYSIEMQMQDNYKISAVFNYVKKNFQKKIALEEVADLVNMTVPSFCRYFKKTTKKKFTKFVNEFRLVHASKLLAEKPISITEICFESGFNNLSYFNKSFYKYTGKTASEYRKELRSVLD